MPLTETQQQHKLIDDLVADLRRAIEELPASHDRSIAIDKLETAQWRAHRAIAHVVAYPADMIGSGVSSR